MSGGVFFGNGLGYSMDFEGHANIVIRLDLIGPDFDIHRAVEQMKEQLEAHWAAEKVRERQPAEPRPSRLTRPRRTSVYRFYDRQGALLYVGKAVDPEARAKGHERRAWWPDVDPMRTTHTWFESERAALDAEDIAIRDENPLYNRIGGGRG
jgi:hypothetical protein